MKVATVVVLVVSAMVMQVAAQTTAQYCALCADHTMCKFTTAIGGACQPSLARTVSAADKAVILAQHNQLRNKVATGLETRGNPGAQPAAANMRKLEWDDELAAVAQRWVDQCMYGHDTCRKVARYEVGQNAALQSSSANTVTADWVWPVNAWYDEVTMYNKANINPFSFNSSTGHYTQVVWATTYQVGCGYGAYKTSPTDTWYRRFYVCNYGPSGNWIGLPLYTAGAAGSQCPTGTAKDATYPGLCATTATAATVATTVAPATASVATTVAITTPAVATTTVSAASYCTLCADHTMCKFTSNAAAATCAPSLLRGVSAAQQQVILDQHNSLRNKVAKGLESRGTPGNQPQAANMRKMSWDAELAAVAQRWVDQCAYGHDTCRKVARFGVGQNAAQQSSTANVTEADWVWPVNAWYDEVALYSSANINPFSFASTTGHYTQVVWANTYLVGCGYASYKKSPTDTWYNRYYICNYGPGGNVLTTALYTKGAACSACPAGTTCDTTYTGLCK